MCECKSGQLSSQSSVQTVSQAYEWIVKCTNGVSRSGVQLSDGNGRRVRKWFITWNRMQTDRNASYEQSAGLAIEIAQKGDDNT